MFYDLRKENLRQKVERTYDFVYDSLTDSSLFNNKDEATICRMRGQHVFKRGKLNRGHEEMHMHKKNLSTYLRFENK